MVQNNSRSKARTASVTHPFQQFSRTDHVSLEEHDGMVSIGGRNSTNLRFADDIDAVAEEK